MERIKNRWRNLSLKKAYIFTVLSFVGIVVLMSVMTILFCLWGRNYLLPDADSAYLTVEKQYQDGTVVEIIKVSLDGGSSVTGHVEKEYGNQGVEGEDIPEGEGLERKEFLQSEGNAEGGTGKENSEGEENEEEETEENISEEENAQFIIGDNEGVIVEDKEDEKVLERYNIVKMEDGYSYLTPKRKAAYRILGAAMIFLPVMYTLFGVLFSAVWFYRHKISRPVQILGQAIEQIQEQNLEFEVESVGEDELGQVCASLEEMRKALYQNNQALWNMLEERKRLQASVAHDLRNPITVIRTCVEYVKLNLSTGNVTEDELHGLIDNVQAAAKRLEQYTDSIRDIGKLEEIEAHLQPVNLTEVLPEMGGELELLAKKEQKQLLVEVSEDTLAGSVDVSLLYRILENLVANAARYAKEAVCVSCGTEGDGICIRVWDDGPGFGPKVLSERKAYFGTVDTQDGHMGMGLSICRILCRKMHGRLSLFNRKDGGAEADIFLYNK